MKSGEHVHDRYVLGPRIGAGGMAEVWQAHDLRLDRDVAIKFLAARLAQDPEFLVRFFAEAQGVARISHPNVIHVLDFGDYEGRSFLVMELATGGSVKDLLGAALPPERAATIVTDAARGAGAAHEHGIVHRDIKPGNILLSEDGTAKLADFGIASIIAGEKLTGTGLAIGSPHYISPEQASGGQATARSDVYSLGVVLYELVTGAKPFDAANVTALAIAHVEESPAPPSKKNPEIPLTLEAIVMRCLEKDPNARYPDGNALADALTGSVGGTVVSPVPAPIEDDTSPFAVTAEPALDGSRSRTPLIAVAALLLAAVAAAAFLFAAGGSPARHLPASRAVASPSASDRKHHRRKHTASPSTLVSEPATAAVPVASTSHSAPAPTPTHSSTSATSRKTHRPSPTPTAAKTTARATATPKPSPTV